MEDEQRPIILLDGDDVAAILEVRKRYLNESWSLASAYDAAIIVAGYGAFFALWSGVSSDVTPTARNLTAFLMGVSLLFYIGWTIMLMLCRHRYDSKFVALIGDAVSATEAVINWEKVEVERQAFLLKIQHRLWMPVFGLTILCGVSAAMILIYNCLAVSIGLPQLTGRL